MAEHKRVTSTKKVKVAISANVLFTILNFRLDLIRFLKIQGFDVVCISNTDDLSNKYDEFLKELDIEFIQINIDRKGVNPLKDFVYLFQLYKIYKEIAPNVIFHFTIKPNIYGTVAAKLAGIPSINTINGLGSAIINQNILSKVLQHMYKFSLQFSQKVFFQNNDDLDFFLNRKLLKQHQTAIVPGSGVDTNSFKFLEKVDGRLTFLLVSRLLKDKGIYEYIEAIKDLKSYSNNLIFLLAGQFDEGNPSAIDESQVKEWEKEGIINYIGKTDNIEEFFKLADVIVLPSYREGLSRVLIEAASSYKPIITTNVAGCKDVVDDQKNGFLCEVKDSNSLKKSIEKMISLSTQERVTMGQYSRKIAEQRFDSKIVNEIYYKEISKVCSMF